MIEIFKEGDIIYKPGYNKFRKGGDSFDRINRQIYAKKIRLIDENGEQLGVVDIEVGLQKAQEKGLDLVEVSLNGQTSVCKIMDYAKYKYEKKKKKKLSQKKQHVMQIKEIRFKPQIEEHDYNIKVKKIKKFLSSKNKVRVQLRFRGREMAHQEIGIKLLNKISEDIVGIGQVESTPKIMGKLMVITIVPKN